MINIPNPVIIIYKNPPKNANNSSIFINLLLTYSEN